MTGRGAARVVAAADPIASGYRPGEVLVRESADTAWLPYLMGASAVVLGSGTVLSHPAVMCRELGRPIVVGAAGITNAVVDDMVLEVDGVDLAGGLPFLSVHRVWYPEEPEAGRPWRLQCRFFG